MELNIDSREVPEFKSLTLLKFITLLSLNNNGSFIVLKLVKKSNDFFHLLYYAYSWKNNIPKKYLTRT